MSSIRRGSGAALPSLMLFALVPAVVGAVGVHQGCSSADTEEAADPEAEVAYTTDGLCDNLPKVDLETPPGVCVGIVAKGFVFPRGLAELPGGDVMVADMGGWATNKGSVWRIKKEGGAYTRTQVLSLIDKPSGIQVNPKDKLVYVGTPKDIFRFDPDQAPRPRLTLVVKGLPPDGRHPLKQFVFDGRDPDVMYVNAGSATDVCEKDRLFRSPCYEEALDRSGIRRYAMTGADRLAPTYTMLARGLRNSMALAVHPVSNVLLQGENSRDSINKYAPELTDVEGDLPHEELNVIDPDGHYGFPYCYDNGVASPEYRTADCSRFRNPALLLPGHAAPLGMKYYTGPLFPADYKGQLVLAYHGYRANGHRLVMVPVDVRGVPSGEPLDIVRGWDKTARHPLGAPVDVMVAKDGSIWMTEDKNGTVLRVFFDRLRGNGKPMAPRAVVRPAASPEEAARCAALARKTALFSIVQRDVIDASCVSCHGAGPGYPGSLALLRCDDVGNAKRLLARRRGNAPPLVVPGNDASELVLRLKGQGYPQMPAGGISPEGEGEVLAWIRGGAPLPPP